MRTTKEILQAAKAAVPALTAADGEKINGALLKIADLLCLDEATEAILEANARDLERAEGISDVMKDRLRLDKKRIIVYNKKQYIYHSSPPLRGLQGGADLWILPSSRASSMRPL